MRRIQWRVDIPRPAVVQIEERHGGVVVEETVPICVIAGTVKAVPGAAPAATTVRGAFGDDDLSGSCLPRQLRHGRTDPGVGDHALRPVPLGLHQVGFDDDGVAGIDDAIQASGEFHGLGDHGLDLTQRVRAACRRLLNDAHGGRNRVAQSRRRVRARRRQEAHGELVTLYA